MAQDCRGVLEIALDIPRCLAYYLVVTSEHGRRQSRSPQSLAKEYVQVDLFTASNQWSSRPADERFSSLEDLRAATLSYRQNSGEKLADLRTFRTEANQGEVMLVGKANIPTRLSYTAFGQLSTRVGAPAGYLRTQPASLAAQNLNWGLANRLEREDIKAKINGEEPQSVLANVLAHKSNGDFLVRALTGKDYQRIWHHEVVDRIIPLSAEGWVVPPARPAFENQPGSRLATEQDVIAWQNGGVSGLSIKVGDLIAPAGLYFGQGTPELFVFMVNPQARIKDGTDDGLSRGFFVTNSEVGDASFSVTTFLLRHVCGNHIVWGAKSVKALRLRHTGSIRNHYEADLVKYLDSSASDEEARIETTKHFVIGRTKDEVLDKVFGARIASRKLLEASYEAIQPDIDGDPNTAWGLAQGVTRVSQQEGFADDRQTIDLVASRILDLPF
jgi:hypothetical protein